MAERTTRTEIINLGNELITGKKSDKYGRLIEPTAEVIPISNNIKLTLDGDVGGISLIVNVKYQEATQKEDVAHFLLEVFNADTNNLLGKQEINSKDVPAKYNELETQLCVKINLEGFAGKTIKLRAHLKCWLEESGWTPRGGGKESVSDEDFVNITLEVPEIKVPKQNPIVSLNVIGRGLAKDEEPKDYEQQDIGKEYRVVATITNSTGNKLTYGELSLFENDNPIKPDPPFKEMVGGVQPITIKRSQDWAWYITEPKKGGRLTITDKKDREFVYKLIYYLRDEYGFNFEDTIDKPLKKLKIVISIPELKLAALSVYNESFDAEDNGDFATFIAALIAFRIGLAGPYGAAVALGITLGIAIGSYLGKEDLKKVRIELKETIDDPPEFDKTYKKIFTPKIKRIKFSMPRTKYAKLLVNITKASAAFVANSEAMRKTAGRVWSAKLKEDKVVSKKQKAAFRKFKNGASAAINSLADGYIALADFWRESKIKIRVPEFITLQKLVKRKGLPRKLKVQLRKSGFSRTKTRKIEKIISSLSISKLNVAKNYLDFSKSLKKLANLIKEQQYET